MSSSLLWHFTPVAIQAQCFLAKSDLGITPCLFLIKHKEVLALSLKVTKVQMTGPGLAFVSAHFIPQLSIKQVTWFKSQLSHLLAV